MTFDAEQYIHSVEDQYDFPKSLQFNTYREPSRNVDVTQVFFRYNPFADGLEDKFGFEIEADDSGPADMYKRQAHDCLETMENTWKSQFNFVYWRDVPYAINEQDRAFTVKCELCHAARSIDKPGDFEYRRDLYMIYLLKEIDHDCSDGWEEPEGVDKDLWVVEGTQFSRFGANALQGT